MAIQVKRIVYDSYSKEEKTAIIDLPAVRVQPTTKIRVGQDGEATYTSISVVLHPDTQIFYTDKILHGSRELSILSIYRATDINGEVTHIEAEA